MKSFSNYAGLFQIRSNDDDDTTVAGTPLSYGQVFRLVTIQVSHGLFCLYCFGCFSTLINRVCTKFKIFFDLSFMSKCSKFCTELLLILDFHGAYSARIISDLDLFISNHISKMYQASYSANFLYNIHYFLS